MKKMKKMSTANDISQRNWDNKGRGGRHMDVVLMRHGKVKQILKIIGRDGWMFL